MTEIQTTALTQMIKNPTIKKSKKNNTTTLDYNDSQAPGAVHANLPGTGSAQITTPSSAFTIGANPPNATKGPLQPFVSAMDLYRAQMGRSRGFAETSTPSAAQSVPNHPFQSVSKTQLEKHAIRMRQMAKALEEQHNQGKKAASYRKKSSSSPFPQPPPPIPLYTAPSNAADPNQNTFKRMIQSMLGKTLSATSTTSGRMVDDDHDILHELDRDLAQAVVFTGGKILGIHPDELAQSPGLRKLVARNIQWFQRTPDWLKLVGLCAAKKLNGYIGGSGSSGVSNPYLVPLPPSPPPVTTTDTSEDTSRRMMMHDVLPLSREEEGGMDCDDQRPPPPPAERRRKRKAESSSSSMMERLEAVVQQKIAAKKGQRKTTAAKKQKTEESTVMVAVKTEDDEPSGDEDVLLPLTSSSSSSD